MKVKYTEALDTYLESVGGLQYASLSGWAAYALKLRNIAKLSAKTVLEPQLTIHLAELLSMKSRNEQSSLSRDYCQAELDSALKLLREVQGEVARLRKHDLLPKSVESLPKKITGRYEYQTITFRRIDTSQLVHRNTPTVKVLEFGKDAWIDPPNEFWSVHHDKLMKDTWEQYLVDIAV
jgi:hypothetical protein